MSIDVKNRGGWYSIYVNGFNTGEIHRQEDGFFQYYNITNHEGYIPSWYLRQVADKVDELNKEWQAEIDKI